MPQAPFSVTTDYMHATAEGCVRVVAVLHNSNMMEVAYIILNKGEYEFSEGSVWLAEDNEGNYRPVVYEDYTWSEITRIDVPVTDRLIFLDLIDPLSGEMLEKPTVHSAEEFLKMKKEEETEEAIGPGFKTHNVIVAFDKEGELAIIQRYYVPWQ